MGKEKKEGGDNGNEEKKEETPLVIKVDMHCEACTKKVVKSLKGFQGVEEVAVDRKAGVIAVKGKDADPVKVCERIQLKTGRKPLVLSPLRKPSEEPPKDEKPKEEDVVQTKDDPKDQPPPPLPVVTIELRVHMHCEACAQLLRKRIRKVKGVESVETDVTKGQVIVKGIIADAEALANYVYKTTKKQVSLVKNEEMKKGDNKQQEKKEEKKESEFKKEEDKMESDTPIAIGEVNRYDYNWPTMTGYNNSYIEHPNSLNYQPQFLSDENPNACILM